MISVRLLPLYIFLFLVPLSFGNIAGIRSLSFYQVATSLGFFLFFVSSYIYRSKTYFFQFSNKIVLFTFIFLLIYILNYFRNPLLPSGLLGMQAEEGGFNIYFEIFLSFALFYLSINYVLNYKMDLKRVLLNLEKVSFVVIVLGLLLLIPVVNDLITFFRNQNLLSNNIEWTLLKFSNGGTRIGILSLITPFYLTLVLSQNDKKITPGFIIKLLFCFFALFVSGGRTAFFSSVLILGIFLFRNKLKNLVFIGLIIGITLSLSSNVFQGYFNRITNVNEDLMSMDKARFFMYYISLKHIEENPVTGVGIGAFEDKAKPGTFEKYISTHLRYGGHGAFLTILFLLGLVGFIPFILMCYYGITLSIKHLKYTDMKDISLFCFYFIAFNMIRMLLEGRGPEPLLFVCFGLIAGISILKKEEVNFDKK